MRDATGINIKVGAQTITHSFLGIEQSLTHRKWVARPYDERTALALAQRNGLPDIVACSLAARGLDLDTAPSFLEPRLRDLLPDPSQFKDMDVAVARFVAAIKSGEAIAVYGDYDVDGGTSSALLLRFARALGVSLRLYVPDRMKEGYGPNANAMRQLAGEGIKLLICVDCGTTAHEALAVAKDAGMDVIVLDHHAAEPQLPPAVAVVNPNRLDDPMSAQYGALAAIGVTYLFVIAVNRSLRGAGFYNETRVEPDLRNWLDLVALGTVCDVVKLSGLNRAFVAQGLKVMAQRGNVGLAALLQISGAKTVCDTYTAGFLLGPRVNAGGRVAESDMGARLLSCDDAAVAADLAMRLNGYNNERREIEARVLAEAEAMMFNETAPIAFVASENWHAGVIGIVASRLKEKFHRPALVVALEGEVGKGSGRSLGNVDLGAAIIAARQAGLLLNGGGHKMAAGFSVARNKIDELKNFLAQMIGKQLEAEPMVPTLSIDGLVSVAGLNAEFMERLSLLAPFGAGNSEPRFALAECRIIRATIVGEKHVSLVMTQGAQRIKAIAFRALDSDLGASLLNHMGRPVHVAGHVRLDDYRNDGSVQMLVDDVAFV